MISFYCPSCGVLQLGNTLREDNGDYNIRCGCGFKATMTVHQRQTKTTAEVEAEFQQTKLTHNQQFG